MTTGRSRRTRVKQLDLSGAEPSSAANAIVFRAQAPTEVEGSCVVSPVEVRARFRFKTSRPLDRSLDLLVRASAATVLTLPVAVLGYLDHAPFPQVVGGAVLMLVLVLVLVLVNDWIRHRRGTLPPEVRERTGRKPRRSRLTKQ
jgi:hypothetical protein